MHRILLCVLIQAAIFIPILAKPISENSPPPDHNDLAGYDKTIFLPYVYAFTSLSTPVISGSIGGTSFKFPVDTGSTGLLIGKPRLSQVYDHDGEPGHQFLDSSSNLYVGRWVYVAVTFDGEKLKQAVSRFPVLIVDESWYCPEYKEGVDENECPNKQARKNNIDDICYMGVGFGRGSAPRYNPFLNVKVIDGEDIDAEGFRNGYYIGTDGIHLGLTNNNTNSAAWVGLDRGNQTHDDRDWSMLKTSFTVDGAGPYSGNALIDTGVAQMYLQSLPSASIPNVTVTNPNHEDEKIMVAKPGTRLKFGFPSLGNANIAGYGFTVGDKKFPSQPYFVQPVSVGPGPFVNTGRKFLWGFSIAFDAVGGRLGFICLKCNDAKGKQ